MYIRVNQPSSISSLSSSSSREVRLVSGCIVVVVFVFGFLVALGAFGFFVGFGGLGFLVGFGGFGFLVGLGAFCFLAFASLSAAFFALASERGVKRGKTFSYLKPVVCVCIHVCHMNQLCSFFKHFIIVLCELFITKCFSSVFLYSLFICLLAQMFVYSKRHTVPIKQVNTVCCNT